MFVTWPLELFAPLSSTVVKNVQPVRGPFTQARALFRWILWRHSCVNSSILSIHDLRALCKAPSGTRFDLSCFLFTHSSKWAKFPTFQSSYQLLLTKNLSTESRATLTAPRKSFRKFLLKWTCRNFRRIDYFRSNGYFRRNDYFRSNDYFRWSDCFRRENLNSVKADPNCTIIAGGNYDKSKGFFVEPTIIVTTDMNVATMREEIFGPVLTIYVYDDDKMYETIDTMAENTRKFAFIGQK